MFHQTFQPRDLLLVIVLVVLEGLLSIDNALVLGLLARRLPPRSQSKALTYGLVGTILFRLAAVAAAAWLLKWRFVKLLGGGYLVYIAIRHFVASHTAENHKGPAEEKAISFWTVVATIELTDMAFATDSILAGIALVGPAPAGSIGVHPKLWVIFLGGMIGVLLMRAAAMGFIGLLSRFPRFETSAYLLVMVVGLKLLADWLFNAEHEQLNFESPATLAFWGFWIAMLVCACLGFLPQRAVSVRSASS